MGTFNHNKKRNSGLVYEFLIRHLGRAMIDDDAHVYQKTLGLVRKYYGEQAPLAEEHELFTIIQNTRGVSENAARRILGEIQRQAQHQDTKKIDIKKSNLIKEINYNFTQNFWNLHRIPEYRLLATIQMVLDAARSRKRLAESVQNIQLEEGLVKYMISNQQYAPYSSPSGDVDQLVMAITAKKFQDRYVSALNESQKTLLQEYIRSQVIADDKNLLKMIVVEEDRVRKALDIAHARTEFTDDPMMMKKLDEACEHFSSVSSEGLEHRIENLMLFQRLIEEVESDA